MNQVNGDWFPLKILNQWVFIMNQCTQLNLTIRQILQVDSLAKYRLSLKYRVTRSLGAARNHKLIILPPEYLSTRWHHLAPLACIVNHMLPHAQHLSYKFGHQVVPLANFCSRRAVQLQMAPPALIANFGTRWRHLHWLLLLPAGDISSKSDHHALVAGDAIRIATLPRIAK